MSGEKDNVEKSENAPSVSLHEPEIDLTTFHEVNAGRLVIDPEEAKIELGEAIAARLKLSRDGTKVLWPQPTDSPNDPQNWSERKKNLHLLIMTLAAIVPDFDSATGIASLFPLAKEYNTTVGVINDVSSNWSIFLLGWGGLFAVMLIKRLGRLPVLFWSQILALAFLLGCALAPNLATFTVMRCLTAVFGTAPQVTGLYVVTDLYPFHRQARKLNIWTMGFIISPFLSPFAFGFLTARTTWRWAYGIACIYGAIVCLLIIFFMDETIYDRSVKPTIPEAPSSGGGVKNRVHALIGVNGWRMSKYRPSWTASILAPLNVVWRPHILSILIFEAALFGFGIGINVTNAVFLGEEFGFSQMGIAGAYGTPIVAVLLGELIGRYTNDWIMNISVRRNKGVFEAESRLWAVYIAIPLYICGFVLLGASIQKHLSIAALVFGWGIAELSIMIATVAVYAYCSDCFPRYQGEVSAHVNLFRTLGGFSVAYFQVPWAEKHGAIQTFGCEAAIVVGLFLLLVIPVQLTGRRLRAKYSIRD